jgi:hypothetical protein
MLNEKITIRRKTICWLDKGVSIKLGDPMTEGHGLDVIKRLYSRLLMLTNRMTWDT